MTMLAGLRHRLLRSPLVRFKKGAAKACQSRL